MKSKSEVGSIQTTLRSRFGARSFALALAVSVLAVAHLALASSGAAPRAAKPKAATSKAVTTPAPATAPAAVSQPTFSGTWALDTLRSEFGNIPGGRWRSRTDVIALKGTELRQSLYMDNGIRRDTTHYVYNTVGRPAVNHVDKQEITAVVNWLGRDLHLVSKTRLLLIEMTLDEKWQLSPDGRVLTMTRALKYPLGEGHAKLVFTRR